MRRSTTVAAIALCGALAAGTAAPAYAAGQAPAVSVPGTGGESMGGRAGDDDVAGVKAELAATMKDINQMIADEKKDAAADVAEAKAEVAAILKEISAMVKEELAQAKPATKPSTAEPAPLSVPNTPPAATG
ncbi:hypothetical protein AB0M94_03900 [Streptomyces xanthochromogenes]|uniref:Phenylalanine-tRNA ligase class II N-terminal domain-containing protein n=1 Tax=Streptomyces xanthochromogenes TaxID=67384 RepID=A0ABQ2ZPE1_9ACTN|nr:hypothetical protein [Streptomyces xanthochromogenes]GGY18680.1 hypothetical protein GCM10010326_09260 [Streptomyces xanthochromogenes]